LFDAEGFSMTMRWANSDSAAETHRIEPHRL